MAAEEGGRRVGDAVRLPDRLDVLLFVCRAACALFVFSLVYGVVRWHGLAQWQLEVAAALGWTATCYPFIADTKPRERQRR